MHRIWDFFFGNHRNFGGTVIFLLGLMTFYGIYTNRYEILRGAISFVNAVAPIVVVLFVLYVMGKAMLKSVGGKKK